MICCFHHECGQSRGLLSSLERPSAIVEDAQNENRTATLFDFFSNVRCAPVPIDKGNLRPYQDMEKENKLLHPIRTV